GADHREDQCDDRDCHRGRGAAAEGADPPTLALAGHGDLSVWMSSRSAPAPSPAVGPDLNRVPGQEGLVGYTRRRYHRGRTVPLDWPQMRIAALDEKRLPLCMESSTGLVPQPQAATSSSSSCPPSSWRPPRGPSSCASCTSSSSSLAGQAPCRSWGSPRFRRPPPRRARPYRGGCRRRRRATRQLSRP